MSDSIDLQPHLKPLVPPEIPIGRRNRGFSGRDWIPSSAWTLNAGLLTTADNNDIAPVARAAPVAGKRGFVGSTAAWQPVSAESLYPAIDSARPAHARAHDPRDQRPD